MAAAICAHPQEPAGSAIVKGYVRDSSGRPVTNATVVLQLATEVQPPAVAGETTHTDAAGGYRFASLPAGAYTLRAEATGYGKAMVARVALARKEMKTIDLVLFPLQNPRSEAASRTGQAPEFFDEPQFTVAGVTEATNSGGHGTDAVVRTSETLAKATVSLTDKATTDKPASDKATTDIATTDKPATAHAAAGESASSLRDALARNPNDAELHDRLGEVAEKAGDPLEAVREYQRAAELDPREPHLYDWGTELLAHRALEPATEVFTQGNRRFPKSVRMLVALAVTWYARGSYDEAEQYLVNASDLAPGDATPYLFMGRMLSAATIPSEATVERLARFARLQPDNALANYYYAVSLFKESAKESAMESGKESEKKSGNAGEVGARDDEHFARAEALLLKAVQLDPKLGAAYLQLGVIDSQRSDFARAISAYEKAITVSLADGGVNAGMKDAGPENRKTLEESHYRLAQAYLRSGDKAKAQEQLQLHEELSRKTKADAARERREIQEFVISMRGETSAPKE